MEREAEEQRTRAEEERRLYKLKLEEEQRRAR